MTLTEFLLARIAEDEATARSATLPPWVQGVKRAGEPGRWRRGVVDAYSVLADRSSDLGVTSHELVVDSQSQADCAHIARHDPARVLAECEAKRRIVEREGQRLREQWRRLSDEHRQSFEQWFRKPYGETLRDLATVYADHPDYDEAWRP